MKHLLPLIVALAAVAICFCTKPAPVTSDYEGLASFLDTRADAPLEGTVWEHQTGEKYNRYVSFRNGEMSLFYGLEAEEGLQRWSDFFTAPYALEGGLIVTELSYPLWGHREVTESVSVVKSKGAYTIDIDREEYTYYGPYTEDLEDLWMSITVNIVPWQL
ncbi:MAG: hypothetical protein IKR30_06290 [Bacteroidales bacterium]|nr:hypothetical protein [Bacteroidales bacterium]